MKPMMPMDDEDMMMDDMDGMDDMDDMDGMPEVAPDPSASLAPRPGIHRMAGQRMGVDMYANPVLDAEPFDESMLPQDDMGGDSMGLGGEEMGLEGVGEPRIEDINADYGQRQAARDETMGLLARKAQARRAATDKFQEGAFAEASKKPKF